MGEKKFAGLVAGWVAILLGVSVGVGCVASGTDEPGRAPDRVNLNDSFDLSGPPRAASGPRAVETAESSLVGHWYLDRDHERWSLVLIERAAGLEGTMSKEEDPTNMLPIERASWDPISGKLRFQCLEGGRWMSYAVDVIDGIMTGRYASSRRSTAPAWSAYDRHLVGWRSETFDRDLAPRVFDITVDDDELVKLRIDRSPSNPNEWIGELKTYALWSEEGQDQPAVDVQVTRWDGEHLSFSAPTGSHQRLFSAKVSGRTIQGSVVSTSSNHAGSFVGTRSDVLTYGLSPKSKDERDAWQERTRRRLFRLTMGGNPAPLETQVSTASANLVSSPSVSRDRDDNSANWRQDYQLTEVTLHYTLANPYGTDPLSRTVHGYLATPNAPAPPEGYPLVLALNGHGGSAIGTFQPDDYYHWYGDSFARRGYMVFAVDISHRPPQDTGGVYDDVPDGDDPGSHNSAHPAIEANGMDSDWSEDGERVWDSMRGIDYLLSQRNVNPSKMIVTGLSMGGEITENVFALDRRSTISIPAGAPPDLSVMSRRQNHRCWEWAHGDITEYIDASDYLAMAAPRRVILQTGKNDYTFSYNKSPFIGDKEAARRGRAAFIEDPTMLVHYLHYDEHHYHVGDVSEASPDPQGIEVPVFVAPPLPGGGLTDWDVNGDTVSLRQTVFDYLSVE